MQVMRNLEWHFEFTNSHCNMVSVIWWSWDLWSVDQLKESWHGWIMFEKQQEYIRSPNNVSLDSCSCRSQCTLHTQRCKQIMELVTCISYTLWKFPLPWPLIGHNSSKLQPTVPYLLLVNPYCWWFRNPAITSWMLVGFSRYPSIHKSLIHPTGGWPWDFWAINSMTSRNLWEVIHNPKNLSICSAFFFSSFSSLFLL